jgi:outer membrane protein insertion porin family
MDDHVEAPGLQSPLHNTAQPRDKEPDEVQRILEWQQKRIERRLRGDYESAVVHLSQLVCYFPSSLNRADWDRLMTTSIRQPG